MRWKNTDGWDLSDMSASIATSDSYALTADERRPFILFTCSAASKALTLGITAGQAAIVMNTGGTNAVTVKNVSTDAGTSVAAGKVALVVAGSAGAGTVTVLN